MRVRRFKWTSREFTKKPFPFVFEGGWRRRQRRPNRLRQPNWQTPLLLLPTGCRSGCPWNPAGLVSVCSGVQWRVRPAPSLLPSLVDGECVPGRLMSCRLPSHSFCWIVVRSETSAPAAATASIITSTTNKRGLKQAQAAAKRYDRSARSKAKPTGRRTRSRARRAAICGTSSRSRRGTVASKGRTSRSAARRLPSASLPPTARRRGRANWRRFGIAGGWWSRRRGRHLPLGDCEGARTAAGAREAALQAKCWAGGWGGHYRIIAFRLLSGPIIAVPDNTRRTNDGHVGHAEVRGTYRADRTHA